MELVNRPRELGYISEPPPRFPPTQVPQGDTETPSVLEIIIIELDWFFDTPSLEYLKSNCRAQINVIYNLKMLFLSDIPDLGYS